MNTNSRTKKNAAVILLLAIMAILPTLTAKAQDNSDEYGIWTTFEASKKINKKFKFGIDAEFRTIDYVSNVERWAIGASLDYKLSKMFKANIGYSFIYTRKPEETNIKDIFDETLGLYNYNVDHAYWNIRNRFYFTLQGEYKVGRVEFTLRERLQYTRTNSTTTDETKYRYEYTDPVAGDYQLTELTEPEFKRTKHNTTLRSRLTAKWDIRNCKITPFASVELYTRLDEWAGCDKLRYRAGASYKFNKDNSISLYFLYQDAADDDEPKGYALGVEYSIDL